MSRKPRALIVGGSVGGLFAAHLLRKIGWDVTVFERASSGLESRGAAIGFTEELFDVLQLAGLPIDHSIGARILSLVALDRAGAVSHEVPRRQVSGAWAHIYRPLRNALPAEFYRGGMALDRIEQDGETITAIFADGARIDGDLLIGADGVQSTVRRQFLPDVAPRYAGYIAWRGVVDETEIPAEDHELFFNHLTFCFPPGEMVVCIPMPADNARDASARDRRSCYVWYRPADAEKTLPELCTDADGRSHGVSIPPPLIRREVIADLKARAAASLPPSVARLVERARQPLFQAIADLESPQLVFGRALLLGDAAFVARPHVVAGVTKAALDARCLADVLRDGGDLDAALARYDRAQRALGTALVSYARQIGAHLEGPGQSGAPERDPDAILRGYGAPHLFRRSD